MAATINTTLATPKQEKEANLFAMCLLMPEELLRPEFEKVSKKTNDEDAIIFKLARMFDVPIFAMTERLRMLNLLKIID